MGKSKTHKWKQKRLCVWVGGQGLEGKGGMHKRHCTLEKKPSLLRVRGRVRVGGLQYMTPRPAVREQVRQVRWMCKGEAAQACLWCNMIIARVVGLPFLRGMSFFSFCFCASAFFFVHLLCVFVYFCLLITAFLVLFFVFCFFNFSLNRATLILFLGWQAVAK